LKQLSGPDSAPVHAFPCLQIVGVEIQYRFPIEESFAGQIQFLKQNSQVTTGKDIAGADLEQFP
jgi:hypothetical protein